MAGIVTSTRCSAGIPPASARRCRRAGCADSLTSRLITATSVSLAGNSISTPASASDHSGSPTAAGWWVQTQKTNASVPSSTVLRYAGRATRRALARSTVRSRSCKPSARASVGRPGPCNQWRAAVGPVSPPSDAAAACIRSSSACATVSSLRPLARARRSMPCSVRSRVPECSASNRREPSIRRIRGLLRATISGQSASPIARSELTALLTLRLSAAWSAPCWLCTAGRSGNAPCSHSCCSACSPTSAELRPSCRRCANCARKTRPTPRCSSSSSTCCNVDTGKVPMRSQHRLATSRAALLIATRSASRRRFSINSTRRVVGRAHISARFKALDSW